MVAGGMGKTRGREKEKEWRRVGGKESETRRHAFRRQLWELRRNTPVSNGTVRPCLVSTNGPRKVRDRVRSPVGRRGKGTVEGAGRGTPSGTTAAFCGGATVTAKALSPRAPTLSGVGVGCAMHPYIYIYIYI